MIVLDSSAGIQMAMMTDAGQALHEMMLQGEKRISSDMYRAEVRNGLWRYVHTGRMNRMLAQDIYMRALGLVDAYVPLEENADESFAAACQYDHSLYDMFYLTLARRYNGMLYTLDRQLQRLCIRADVDCIQIADLPGMSE